MNILIVNAGSSSLKYQLIDMRDESVKAKGLVDRIGIAGCNLVHNYCMEQPFKQPLAALDHTQAMSAVLSALLDPQHGVISSIDEIGAVGHRVLHGGEKFTESIIINQAVVDAIREYIPLGPLHNPANLMGIEACRAVMPNTQMVAVFDTAFHQTMPRQAYMYGIPYEYYEKYHIRRYGFHGTSHRYVSGRLVELLGKPRSKVIVCHLGNGSSLSAVVDGKCVDTSMGLTPLEGVLMGTRSGNVDPAVVEYIASRDGKSVSEVLSILNKESGLKGVSGRSSDMRDVVTGMKAGDWRCAMAREMWAYGIRKYIGAYAAAMGGLDALAFTAGIGENDQPSRALVLEGLSFLGIELDAEKNAKLRGEEGLISTPDSRVQVYVIPTNEELAIARDTLTLVKK